MERNSGNELTCSESSSANHIFPAVYKKKPGENPGNIENSCIESLVVHLSASDNSSSRRSSKMNAPELNTEYLFSEDLIKFVMQGYDLPFSRTPTFMRSSPVRFVPCVGHVVRYLSSLQEDKTLTAFDYLRCTILSGDHFDEFASGMVEAHFNGEFQMLDFLCFCAQLSRLSVLFYLNNITDAPLKTVTVISTVLQKERLRFLAAGGWDTLYDLCFYVLHRIPRRQRCRVPSKSSA